MRIWSLHPQYLDSKGLVALWRETLLAKHVLEGRTKGYTNHPQLQRFKMLEDPVRAIHQYLEIVYNEALARGYGFDATKFEKQEEKVLVSVTDQQLRYEFEHLLRKLEARDPERFERFRSFQEIVQHPMFSVVAGPVEQWEIITDK